MAVEWPALQAPENPVSVFIALGANLQNPAQQLHDALIAIQGHPDLDLKRQSSLYGSDPMGPADQPAYINAVCMVLTCLSPLALLDTLQAMESAQGRVRDGQRWGPRTLDLDLLLYADHLVDHPRLCVPHPGITQRSFVLLPLLEIAPEISLPGLGLASDYQATVPMLGLSKMEFGFEA